MDWALAVEAEPAGILVGDGDGRLSYLNPAAARVLRSAGAEPRLGHPVAELLRGFPVTAGAPRGLPDGGSVWYLSAEALAEREEAVFAVEVSDALAGNLDVRRTLGRVADLVVPCLATWASVTLWDNDRIRQVSRGPGAHLDDRAVPASRLDEAGRRRIRRAIDADWEELKAADPEELSELGATHAAAVELLADGPVKVVTFALRAFGSALGSLALCARPGCHREVLSGLARRAAVAVHAARIYEERSTLAATLRSALLPADLPVPPGLQVGSIYRPAMEATEIGGDFYEMAEDGSGWSFSVGDVCGKGVEAAVLTGQIRQSLGTVALVSSDPAERLRLLNAAMLRADGTSFVTLLHAVLHQGDGHVSVRMAAGGHPPPLLRHRDGRVDEVEVGGPIVGMLSEVEFRPTEFRLEAGDMLVCFTDGLPDARGTDGLLGVGRLRRILADCHGLTPQATAERLLQSALDHLDGRPHDDMAILAVQAVPVGDREANPA